METEVNQDGFDTKMNPTKIAEKNWDHTYKLSQLIGQQEKMMDKDAFFLTMIISQFGGVSESQVQSAFEPAIRSKSSTAGYRSPPRSGLRNHLNSSQ